jgi:hypothetical protein
LLLNEICFKPNAELTQIKKLCFYPFFSENFNSVVALALLYSAVLCFACLFALVLGSGFLVRLISPTISYSKPSPPIKPVRRKLSNPQQQDYVPLNRPHSPSGQDRPPSSAFLNRLAETMRDKRSQLEVRKDEFMSETLPEWKVRSADFSSMAKETGMEWSKRGRTAVDRWKKDRMSMFLFFFSCYEAVKMLLVMIIKKCGLFICVILFMLKKKKR